MPEWKDTVNLPRTDFPMKANLPTSEPEPLARGALCRRHEPAVPAARRARHVGRAVPDDGLPVSGGDCARVREIRRAAARVQREEAGSLVHPLPDGAC